MTGNADRIAVPGGISNPYNHTWEIGLNIQHWWPVNGVQDCILVGNDGKLWAAANDQYYGYLHEICSWDGDCSGGLTQTGVHNFTVEIQGGCTELDVQFYLGVGNNKPTKIPGSLGTDDGAGVLYMDFDYNLQLNTNYYFQISVSANGPAANDYYISNCAPGCADTSVVGFPSGCYIYSWREDNTVLDLSGGGNWKDDVGCWAGGTCGGAAGGGGGGGDSGPGSGIPSITGGNTFGGNSEVDILPYLTQNHQGQPTPGMHSVELSSADGIRAQVTASVRVRDWQPKDM
jgi:hypothetical protein